jgi:tight adherence protein C
MPIQVIIGAIMVAAALPLLVYSVAGTAGHWLSGKRTSTLSDVTDVRELVLNESPWARLGQPMAQSLGATLVRLTPNGWIARLDRDVTLAGMRGRVSVERLMLAKLLLAVGLFLFGWFFIQPRIEYGWIFTLALTALGFVLPDVWISRQAKDRQDRIQIELPDVIDQITMSVEAGLGFEAALARAARSGEGPMPEELRRTIQEMHLGVSRSDALRHLADRSDVADLRSFVVTVTQSERYGLSIAKVLEVQAAELRDKRRQRAEERALRIPVLLIFPLAFCIFPTILIILLGPAVMRMAQELPLIAP